MNMKEDFLADSNESDLPLIVTGPVSNKRLLSGIQPSGILHLGNYYGAIVQHIHGQYQNDCSYFIANLHALTTVRDAALLERQSLEVALDYLALGIDPERTALYLQTGLRGVTELAWVLSCLTGTGELERSVSFKDKVAKGLQSNSGLFMYPVLMAADILIARAEVVPVGADQLQNIELARRLGMRFNNVFGKNVLTVPQAQLSESRIVPGLDGNKMSKSYGNTIPIFASKDEAARLIGAIKTDSTPIGTPKDPAECRVFALLKLMAEPYETEDWARRYGTGGVRYSEAKGRLLEIFEMRFAEPRERRLELATRPDRVHEILHEGATRIMRSAAPVLNAVYNAVGVSTRNMTW